MDKQKADKLISQYQKKIFGFALSKLCSLDMAEELAADICCEVYLSFLKADNIVNPDGYVYRVAHNVYAKHIRSMKGERTISIEELIVPPAFLPQDTEDENTERLRREINLLTQRQRSIIYMHYYEKKSVAEIARASGISEGTVKWHLSDARKNLKEGLDMTEYTDNLSVNPIKFVNMGHGGSPGADGDTSDMFDTRLKQNIAWSCYRTPLTAEEIARQVGVPLVYIEDDLKKLEYYGYIDRVDNSKNPKYRTNMVIYDDRINYDNSNEIEMRRQATKLLCDKFYPQVFAAIDESEDNLGFHCDGDDKNFIKYNFVMLCTNTLFNVTDNYDAWRKCLVKRPDGGEFISYASVSDDCYREQRYDPYGVCGFMTRGNEESGCYSMQLNCRYDSRIMSWQDNLESDWETLSDYIRSGCDKNAIAAEGYKRLCDKGYVADEKVQVMYYRSDRPTEFLWNFFKERFSVPEEITEYGKNFDRREYEIATQYFPEHILPIIKLLNTNILSGGIQVVYVIEEMLERRMLAPLTEAQKNAVLSVLICK